MTLGRARQVVLVCGSRDYADYDRMKGVLDMVQPRPTIIVNGAMSGADALSSFYAYERKINTLCYGAMWGTHGSSAGPRRNQDMLNQLTTDDLVVAFLSKPLSLSRGTAHMVRIAGEAGVRVWTVLGDQLAIYSPHEVTS